MSEMRAASERGAYRDENQDSAHRCAIEVVQHRNERVLEDLDAVVLRVQRVDCFQEGVSRGGHVIVYVSHYNQAMLDTV